MNDEQKARILRLVSDGKDNMSGGGLTLPDAFGGVLEYLQDFGTTPLDKLVKHFADIKPIRMKEARIIAIWGSWEKFAQDVVNQLADKGLIVQSGTGWQLPEDFQPGLTYEYISTAEMNTARGTRSKHLIPHSVTVFDNTVRAARDNNYKAMNALRRCQAELDRLGMKDDPFIQDVFIKVIAHLEHGSSEEIAERITTGRASRQSFPKPEDNPDHIVECHNCGLPKPQTQLYYEVYWTRPDRTDANFWGWRPTCKDCRNPDRAKRREEVRVAINELTENTSVTPSALAVMRHMNKQDDRRIRLYWDELTQMGKVPPRPTRG